jgi:tRNA (guanine-N7-)-methyltransferase
MVDSQTPSAVIQLTDITSPLSLYDHFDSSKPLEVDVGCGLGRFLMARATAHPEIQFLGIDRMLKRIRRLDRKICRANLNNARLLRLEAFYSLEYLLPPKSVDTFHIYFPDPWPKRRHHQRRLFSEAFLDLLFNCLKSDGTVQIATDHADYFENIKRVTLTDTRFCETPHRIRHENEYTDFELIFRKQGLPIYECALRLSGKNQVPS